MYQVFDAGLSVSDLVDLRSVQRRYGAGITSADAARNLFDEKFPVDLIDLGPNFDAAFYLEHNIDVREAGINPLSHFLGHGQYEGRRPSPDFDRTKVLSEKGKRIRSNLLPHITAARYFALTGHSAEVDVDPVMHYFSYGHRMNLPLFDQFDPVFYAAQNPEVDTDGALNHYLFFGHLEGRAATPDGAWTLDIHAADRSVVTALHPYLDPHLYRAQLDPHIAARVDLAMHYFYFGERAGLLPNDEFNPKWYAGRYPDIQQVGRNYLHHFETVGRAQRRSPNNTGGRLLRAETAEPLQTTAPDPRRAATDIWVIVPVYDGFQETMDCLQSVLSAATDVPFTLCIINDASPNADLSHALGTQAASGLFEYHINVDNLGFVGTSNAGLQRALDAGATYAVLLNSDTRVYDHWLDGLWAAMQHSPQIGSATAFSNNATIFSYPYSHEAAQHALDIPQAQIAQAFARSRAAPVEAPTGMGFALMLCTKALKTVGLLDRDTFGRGYGEEVDLCRRLARAGYLNVCAPRTYITHYGGISFGISKVEANKAAQDLLDVRYPDYHTTVFDFINSDPFRRIRRDVDALRLKEALAKRAFIISITHDLGGGIATFCQDFYSLAHDAGQMVLEVQLHHDGAVTFDVTGDGPFAFPNMTAMRMDGALDLLAELCALPTLSQVFVQSLITLPVRFFDRVRALFGDLNRAGTRIVYIGHDYQYSCPRANFIDNLAQYCRIGADEKCDVCVSWAGRDAGSSIRVWRAFFTDVLQAADICVFPDSAGLDVFRRAVPNVRSDTRVVPHREPHLARLQRPAQKPAPGQAPRICMVGALGPHKGSRLIRSLAQAAMHRGADVTFHIVGYTDLDLSDFDNIITHGRYAQPQEALNLIDQIDPHLCVDLSIWPETFCYTLSIMMASGRPVTCLDIGAQANRLREAGCDVLDYGLSQDPYGLLDRILDMAQTQNPAPARPDWSAQPSFADYQ